MFPVLHRVDSRCLPVMARLHDHPRTVAMNGFGESGQTGDEAILGQRRLMDRRGANGPCNGRRLENEETDAALGPGFVMGDVEIGDLALVTAVLIHRRHDDAIAGRHRSDEPWRKKMSVSHGDGS